MLSKAVLVKNVLFGLIKLLIQSRDLCLEFYYNNFLL
jgi:hypothetical protein